LSRSAAIYDGDAARPAFGGLRGLLSQWSQDMKDFERDYPDHTTAPYFEHGDEPQCNTSDNPTFYEVMEAHVQRRSFLMGGLATISTGLFGNALSGEGRAGAVDRRRAGFWASRRSR
jgi:hypothetical protein